MLEPGTLLEGKYKIEGVIGKGGMSVVYRAVVESANKMWAVKEVRKDGKNDYNVVQQNLIAEIHTLIDIGRQHPKIPEIAEVIDRGDTYIIIMDYIEGKSLEDTRIEVDEETGEKVIVPQAESDVKEWAMQLCDVLGFLHSKDIIYRDMKPSNIMLRPDGSVIIIDFGTAKKFVYDSGETTGLGTAGYAAPEQYGGDGRTDVRTDIYSLGMTMYSLLTGVDPQSKFVETTSVRQINPALSEEIDQIIQKCTNRARDERYQSCAELLYDLEHMDVISNRKKKEAWIKTIAFGTTLMLSISFAVAGFCMLAKSRSLAADRYDEQIADAAQSSSDEEKVKLYLQAINIPEKAGDSRAYLGLLQTYKTNGDGDPVFTDEEAGQMEKIIIMNRAELTREENLAGYVDICFEMGKMFWYYYQDENEVTRSKYAVEWFQVVTDKASPETFGDYNLAKVYRDVGIFYRDIATKLNEVSDKGMYKEMFTNIQDLMATVATDENEAEIVRLELMEMARSTLHRNATRLKRDGVTLEEMKKMYQDIFDNLDTIYATEDESDKVYLMKKSIQDQMEDTISAIEAAFSTAKGK